MNQKLFLEVVKGILDRMSVADINATQLLMLINVSDSVIAMGEVISREFYIGTNPSYNMGKLTSTGYIEQMPSEHDKRVTYIKLTDKALKLCEKVEAELNRYVKKFKSEHSEHSFEQALDFIKTLNRFWANVSTLDL